MAHTRKTRGKGEGSVYQRGDGHWVGAVEAGRYPNGKRRRLRVVRRHKADVLAAMGDLRRTRTAAVPTSRWTVDSYLAYWLADVKAGTVSADTLRDYRTRAARITAVIGHVRLGLLTKGHVQGLANELAERYPRSPRTRNMTLALLREALRWAVPDLIGHSPAEGVRGPRTPVADIDDTFTDAEAKTVLATAAGDRLGALAWLALTYGLRKGELRRLCVADIDLTAGTLAIPVAKTRAGVRTLPLTADARRVLAGHLRRAGVIAGHVFTNPDGRPLSEHDVSDYWNDLLGRAGIAHLCRNCASDCGHGPVDGRPCRRCRCSTSVRRFHSSRHTAATLLIESGVEIEVVSKILGHSKSGITSDIYAKVRDDRIRRGLAGQ